MSELKRLRPSAPERIWLHTTGCAPEISSPDADWFLSVGLSNEYVRADLYEQQEMELEILRGAGSNFRFTPSDDYALLLKQSQAMAGLIRSLEGQRDIQTARMIGMERRLAETDRSELDALRNTNEMLTPGQAPRRDGHGRKPI